VVAKLNAEVQRVLALPEVRQRLAQDGAVAVGNTPEQFAEQIRRELGNWQKVAREANLKFD
jgi:tripartite-type tricarboxylate transporter receptor subunit TctC